VVETAYRCDVCQTRIESGRTRIEVMVGTLAGMPIDLGTGRTAVDLCTECRDRLGGHLAEEMATHPVKSTTSGR
jgi:hypothetical protein